jgi:RND family efflux transporter MFP subunit
MLEAPAPRLTFGRVLVRTGLILTPVAILGVAVGANIALGAARKKPEPAAAPPAGLAVFTSPVVGLDYQVEVETQGVVTARREALVAPQVGGRVTFVAPELADGGIMRANAVLARIDDADYQLAVTRAEAGVAQARQGLLREQAEADLARQDWAEIGEGAPSPLALREPQLAQARANLAAAEATLADARLALARTVIRAPFEGRVLSRSVEIGQIISPGQVIARGFATDAVEVSLRLSDRDLALSGLPPAFVSTRQTPGPMVRLSATIAGVPQTWEGRVERTSAAIDERTRLLSAIVVVNDPFARPEAPLAPGQFVNATLTGVLMEDVVKVPREALRGDGRVFVADGELLRIREVEVLHSDTTGAVLRAGVSEGEPVIVSPVQAPFEGMRIRPQPRDAGSADTREALVAAAPAAPATN